MTRLKCILAAAVAAGVCTMARADEAATATSAPASSAPATSAPATTAPAATPKDLSDTIDKALALLKDNKPKEVVVLLISPKDLGRKKLEAVAEEFALDREKVVDLTLALANAKKSNPEMNAAGTQATFPSGLERRGGKLVFVKIGGRWYVEN